MVRKQPQDFGVNANLGGQASFNWGVPLLSSYGLGMQLGSGVTATSNAVRVYELLGEPLVVLKASPRSVSFNAQTAESHGRRA